MSRLNLTDITLVLDRSGSMGSVREATIAAFNKFLRSQRAADGAANLTLVQFDDQYEVLYEARDVQHTPELDAQSYVPRATTALLDAMGRTMLRTGERLSAMPEPERPGAVLFVTLTDGLENASREFDVHRINAMIAEQRDKYSWQFLFLAANQDAIATAASFGIHANQALTFGANDAGVAATMGVVDQKVAAFRKSRATGEEPAPVAFDHDDRAAAIGKPSGKTGRKRKESSR